MLFWFITSSVNLEDNFAKKINNNKKYHETDLSKLMWNSPRPNLAWSHQVKLNIEIATFRLDYELDYIIQDLQQLKQFSYNCSIQDGHKIWPDNNFANSWHEFGHTKKLYQYHSLTYTCSQI